MFFWLTQVTSVPEVFLTAMKLSHDDRGARYLHLAREDTNNLFRYVVHCKNMVLNVLFKSGMSNLLASLCHIRRTTVSGHTQNTLTLRTVDELKKK